MTINFFRKIDEYQLLFAAVEKNNLHVVEQVLPHISDINRYQQKGEILCTALTVAVQKGYVEMTCLLLEHGADINSPVLQSLFSFPDGNPVIVSNNELQDGELILRYPVISRPLMIAAEMGHKPVFNLLVEKGAELNFITHEGSPVFAGVEKGNLQMVALFLEAGINVNERNENGDSLLHRSVKLSHAALTQLLLRFKADSEALDFSGKKPIHYAKNEEIKNYIVYGPDYSPCPCVLM
ncbi:hypothetical protein B1207_00770 [Legionella quinlivanii]|uniref:Uncharacterized protein n=1 Tax=Legionella quinlivanii TaxID=45073 RepID=A0A364LN35_9GAMM|nr:ankyrin repeat domain-containing protein [Legionella quinlivanii]RAP38455.1 hypothetical protein B1207_00770 [Legionella quinlivanii]